jgi:N-acetyl-gamma-glutamyl-phosphate reductase
MNTYTNGVRVGIAGATGYTGVELIRLLSRHPRAHLAAAMGSPGAAPRIVPALKRLWDAPVSGLDLDALAEASDAVFLALPDHAAAEVAPPLVARGKRVFDLSGAFRLRDAELRRKWYPHTPDAAADVVYGLTERYRDRLPESTLVACAGCYPTAAILALQPLLAAGLLDLSGAPIIIDAKSGVSGAGKTPSERTHFSECQSNRSSGPR